MNSLPYLHLSRDVWIGLGIGFAVALVVMWLLVWFGRRRYVIIGNSPTVEMMAYQLGRIADTLDRLSMQGAQPQRVLQQSRQTTTEAQREIEPSRERESQQVQPVPEPAPDEHATPTQRISLSMFGR